MSINLILSKKDQQSLTKRIQQSLQQKLQQKQQQQQQQQLELELKKTKLTKKTTQSIFSLKNLQLQETTSNTPKQQHSEQQTTSTQHNFHLSNKHDHHRHPLAHKDGGLTCDDPKQIDKLRSVGKQLIKIIGRKILSGQFNLTKISIPIKSCYPKTALYNSTKGYSIFPYFMKTAAQLNDPLEQFKITLTCLIAQPYYLNMFLKPLNPILGETLQSTLVDGTKVYAEQISHHPPVSYFLICGEGYRFSGYYDIQVSPSVNSLTIKNKGKRKFQFFKTNTIIQTTYATNQFSGTFFGTSRVEDLNSFRVEDKKNSIYCDIEFGKLKKKPTDHFISKIYKNGIPKCEIEGSCLGYFMIDGKRYWDGRDLQAFDMMFGPLDKRLPSDWEQRSDLQALQKGDMQNAQLLKQRLEELQRQDAKLRKRYKKQGEKHSQK